jgi:hypothetical protein
MRLARLAALATLALALLAAPLVGEAQSVPKTARIGILGLTRVLLRSGVLLEALVSPIA